MANPISHSETRENSQKYKVEPYVVVADIYSHPSHLGSGGWSWYTGSAAWLYRVGIEWILGFRLQGESFIIQPCIPKDWNTYKVTYRNGSKIYDITVENPSGVCSGVGVLEVDGMKQSGISVPLDLKDGNHTVRVVLGKPGEMNANPG